jgi:hypothetical protein
MIFGLENSPARVEVNWRNWRRVTRWVEKTVHTSALLNNPRVSSAPDSLKTTSKR